MYFHNVTNTTVLKINDHCNTTTNRVIFSEVGRCSGGLDVSKHYGKQKLREKVGLVYLA